MDSFLTKRELICSVFDFLENQDIENFTFINKYIYECVYEFNYYKDYKLTNKVDTHIIPFKHTNLVYYGWKEWTIPTSVVKLELRGWDENLMIPHSVKN